jgi:hypothetical protein
LPIYPGVPALLSQMKAFSEATWTEPMTWSTPYKSFAYFFTTKFGYDASPIPVMLVVVFVSPVFVCFVFYVILKKKQIPPFVSLCLISSLLPLVISYIFSALFFPDYQLPLLPDVPARDVCMDCLGIALFTLQDCVPCCYCLDNPCLFFLLTLKFIPITSMVQQGRLRSFFMKKKLEDELIITFDNTAFLSVYHYLDNPEDLYFYSPDILPDCFGINTVPGRYKHGDMIDDITRGRKSLVLVMVPWNRTEEKSVESLGFTLDPDFEPGIFQYKWSWIRFKVLRYIRL